MSQAINPDTLDKNGVPYRPGMDGVRDHMYDAMLKLIKAFDEALEEIANDVFQDPTLFAKSQRIARDVIETAEEYRFDPLRERAGPQISAQQGSRQ